jgi:uncharacterized protein
MRLHRETLASDAPALVVLCERRRVRPGAPTTALAAAVGAQVAVKIAQALLECVLEDAEMWPGPVVLALAQPSDLAWAAMVARSEWSLVGQASGNPGERINAVDQLLRRHGGRSLVYVGENAPVHREADYAAARTALQTADVVLMPSDAGGVTLMATRRPWPDLATLAWNTTRLGAELAYLCEREGLRVDKLTRRYHVVGLDDLARVVDELASDPRPKRAAFVEIARHALDARTS